VNQAVSASLRYHFTESFEAGAFYLADNRSNRSVFDYARLHAAAVWAFAFVLIVCRLTARTCWGGSWQRSGPPEIQEL
jgi:hypothetical protein